MYMLLVQQADTCSEGCRKLTLDKSSSFQLAWICCSRNTMKFLIQESSAELRLGEFDK